MLSRSEPASIALVCADMCFEAIVESCDFAVSYATSAREAAWRGDRRLLAGHLAQLRACVVTALDAHKRIGASPDGGAHCELEFARLYADRLRFDLDAGVWREWTGSIWQESKKGLAFHFARELARDLAANEPDKFRYVSSKTSFAAGV